MEKCKKHKKELLPCRCERYGGECSCLSECTMCVKVRQNDYQKSLKKCNWVIEIEKQIQYGFTCVYTKKMIAMKFKPRNRLKAGDYAVLDGMTGYLIKATGPHVQFYVVK